MSNISSIEYKKFLVNELPLVNEKFISSIYLFDFINKHKDVFNIKFKLNYKDFMKSIDNLISKLNLKPIDYDVALKRELSIKFKPNDEIYFKRNLLNKKETKEYLLDKKQIMFLISDASIILTSLLVDKLEDDKIEKDKAEMRLMHDRVLKIMETYKNSCESLALIKTLLRAEGFNVSLLEKEEEELKNRIHNMERESMAFCE